MDKIDILYNIIIDYELNGEEVANLFIGWNGSQIVTDEFISNLIDVEGYNIEYWEGM